MNADMAERGPSVLARTRVALGLLAGLRGHDFHAAWTFMHMTWPHDAAPVRLLLAWRRCADDRRTDGNLV